MASVLAASFERSNLETRSTDQFVGVPIEMATPLSRDQHGVSRRCQRATPGSGESPCSIKSTCPPAFNTRRISVNAAMGSRTEHKVHVITTVSKTASENGSCSPDARTNNTGTAACAAPHQ
jgi:hypothetical protein